jgi:phosphopantetheine adenylyltransferase
MQSGRRALLLLPPPPLILSSTNIKVAYGPVFDAALNHTSRTDNPRLDIAIAVPSSWLASGEVSRTALFERAQKALAHTYSLVCATAVRQQVELDCLGGVDARAFFLLPDQEPAGGLGSRAGGNPCSGPYVNLATLIESQRTYDTLYGVASEDGERLLDSFLVLYESEHQHRPICERLPGGLSIRNSSNTLGSGPSSDRLHTSVAVGGTFDHLHIGHKLLLTATALLAEPRGSQKNPSQAAFLTIGISGDDLLTKKKYAQEMESWAERQQKVAEFLESAIVFSAPSKTSRKAESISKPGPNGTTVRVTFESNVVIDYVQISDPFGPTITDENISALVLSQETRSGGDAINKKRQERGWAPLDVFEIDVLETNPSDDEEKDSTPASAAFECKISSAQIRRRVHEKRTSER